MSLEKSKMLCGKLGSRMFVSVLTMRRIKPRHVLRLHDDAVFLCHNYVFKTIAFVVLIIATGKKGKPNYYQDG